jgi:hypothetical protein
MKSDPRRYHPIEVRRINASTYHLCIDGKMWSEVEWSPSRRAWCIQDAAGHCLAHVEHILDQNRDVETAIRLAKRMILDGRMPTPEQAYAALAAESQDDGDYGDDYVEMRRYHDQLELEKLEELERARLDPVAKPVK